MKITGSVNSHIQVPLCVLKEFSSSEGFLNEFGKPERYNYVYHLCQDKSIEKLKVEEANAEFGYFEDEVEKYLSQLESDFSIVKSNIIKCVRTDQKEYFYKETDVGIIKQYCSLCWVRSPAFVKQVKEKSVLIDILANAKQNAVIYTYLCHRNIVDDIFKNLNFTVIINKSNINFLLPQYGVVCVGKQESLNVYIPISTKVLILLSRKNYFNNGNINFGIFNETEVDKFNKIAITTDFKYNVGSVFAKKENDLTRYKDHISRL